MVKSVETNHQTKPIQDGIWNLTKLWWNLNITQLNSRKSFEPNLHDVGFHPFIFWEVPTFTNFPSLEAPPVPRWQSAASPLRKPAAKHVGSARHPVLINGYNMFISWVPPPPPQKMPSSQRWRVGIPLKNTLSTSSTPRVRSGTLFLTQDSGISKSGRSEITMILWGIIAIIVK